MKKRFRSLELTAKNWINTFFSGVHLSSYKDSLIDIDTIRDYQPGDRKLDSKSSIKSGRVMSRVFNPERAMTIFVILDLSSSQITKFDAAITTGLFFSYLAENLSNRLGLMAFSDRVISFIEPGDSSLVNIFEDLYKRDIETGEKTDFTLALSRSRSLDLKNTLFVLISDFCFEISEEQVRSIRQMAMEENNSFISAIMLNKEEWLVGNYNFDLDFSDLETDDFLKWRGSEGSMLESWKKHVKLKLRQARAEPLFLEIDDEQFMMPIVRYLSRG